jgi:hypothetical protein
MNRGRSLLLAMTLALAPGCRHHTLTPSIGGRPAQTIRAEARKAEDGWVVTMPLPLGAWTPKAVGEEQAMDVVVLDGKASLRWKVRPERWANSDRPFTFQLVGAEGRTIDMSVTYTFFGQGTQNVLNILAHGWLPVPLGQ